MQQQFHTKEIEQAISSIFEQRRWLDAKYAADKSRLARSLRKLEEARDLANVEEKPPSRGYVATLIPIMERRGGVMKLETMLSELRAIKGFAHVTLASLEATISSELHNRQPRLRRIAPRTFAVIRSRDEVLLPRAA